MSQLTGKKVLITRPFDQAQEWASLFQQRGASVYFHPVIQILPPETWDSIDQAIKGIEKFNWLVFSSVNGVRFFWQRMQTNGLSAASLAGLKIAAVGQQTANVLADHGLTVSLIPTRFDGGALAQELVDQISPRNSVGVLVCRADRGSRLLEQILSRAGIRVTSITVYRNVDVPDVIPEIADLLRRSAIDWVTLTSPAIAASSVRLFGELLRNAQLASISPKTSKRLKELGYWPTVEAQRFDRFGLLEAMESAE